MDFEIDDLTIERVENYYIFKDQLSFRIILFSCE